MVTTGRRLLTIWAAALLVIALGPAPAAPEVLEFVQSLEGPPTLGDAISVAFSPDGRQLYVASLEDDVVMVYDVSGGTLELLATVSEGPEGPGSLRLPYAVEISADGKFVYVSSLDGDVAGDDAIMVFERDPANGALTFVEAELDGVDGVEGIRGPYEMVISPDGSDLYVAGYSSNAVAAFRRDPTTGKLTFMGAIFDTTELSLYGPSSMAFTPNGRFLFVVSARNLGVTRLERDPATGLLTVRDLTFTDLTPYDVTVSRDGRYVYITSALGGVIFDLDESTGTTRFAGAFGEEFIERDHPDGEMAISPDGRFVYTLSGGSVTAPFRVYERDPETGLLSLVGSPLDRTYDLPELKIPRDLAVSPDGSRVAVVSGLLDALALLERDAGSDTLRRADVLIDGSDGVDGLLGASSVVVSPDGKNVYATGYWDNALVALERDPGSGRLRFVEAQVDGAEGVEGLRGAQAVGISPDGRHLYVTAEGAVAVFQRQADSGKLSFVEAHFETNGSPLLSSPWVAVSPDGAYVYAGGAVFSLNQESGALTLVAEDDLRFFNSVVISPDGRHLYAVEGNIFAVFERDLVTGVLTRLDGPFTETCYFVNGIGATELCSPWSLAISPDGRELYVGLNGFLGGGVMAFERDSHTGSLTQLATYVEAEGYWDSALPPDIESVTVAPDGRYVYVVSSFADGVVVYSRDRATGALTFDEAHYDRDVGIDGLFGAMAAAISPDSRHLYVAAYQEDSVTTFKKNCATSGDALCLDGERFQVEIEWRDFAGKTGRAQVVPYHSDDSGLFWFFSAENWEMLVKVLDGCGINDRFWVFAAATTNVEYTLTVTDMETGFAKSYVNPLGIASAAITDTGALAACSAGDESRPPLPSADLLSAPAPDATDVLGVSATGPSALNLGDGRFRVEVEWRDFQGQSGFGRVVPYNSDDSGLFWFFSSDNWEMLVKVLDGCGINDRFWVFAAATTNVEYTLRVTDTATGTVKTYKNPLGVAADTLTDTGAFATCRGAP